MADLDIVGTAAVDVVPIAPGFHDKLKAMVLPSADRVGDEAGRKLGDAIADAMMRAVAPALPNAVNAGGQAAQRAATRQGSDTGGAFARSLRAKLQAAFKAMPKLDVKLGDTGVDAELARIRAKLETLSNKRIGIDVSAEAAEAEITRLEEQLRELGASHPNVAVRADTATARAALAEIRAEIAAIGGRRTVALEVDGAFGARLRAVVEAAQASIPDINIDADTSPARAEIQGLRAQLAALADARVGIDIDAGEAMAQITAIQTRLEILSIQRNDIDVRVDAAAAAAQLAALKAMADDTKVFRIKALADTSQATSALMHLGIQMAILTAIPLGPVIAAGLGAVVTMATAAAAGVGAVGLAAVPAIKGVTDAVKAKTAADDEAARTSQNAGQAAVQAAQRALQMAGAQQALESAHRNAARSIAQANRQIEDAERAVAQAAQRGAEQRRQAVEAVERAEESLVDAKRDAQRAEQDLTQARADAARQLQDLNQKLADGVLDQREAALRVREAQEELQRVMADPTATDLQRQRAQLAADQAEAAAARQKRDYADLQKEAAKQKKAGVSGNEAVKDAAERLADAHENVRDQTEAVADAQRDAARVQVQAAQDVADAQRRVADAVENAANTQVSAAESIEAAERGLESARLSGLSATSKVMTKQAEYERLMAKLTPAQRDLYDSIAGPKGLKSAFDAWQKSLQPHTLPIFTRAVDGAKNSLPGLTPLVEGAAKGIQNLMDRASAQMKTPFWQGFKQDLAENVQPAVEGFGVAFGNVIKGMAGIIDAFLPHMDGIASKSDAITSRFAKWGTSLKGSPQFEKFLDYVNTVSGPVGDFIGKIASTVLDLAKALAPFTLVMLAVLSPILDGISWLAENAPGAVQALWGIYFATKAIALGMALFAGAMLVYETVVAGATLVTLGWAAAIHATGIGAVLRAIALIIGIVVAAVIYAYNNWDWFRAVVDGAVKAIGAGVSWLWENILKPAFDGIWWIIKGVGDVAVWLWENAIKPAFGFIAEAAQILFTALVTVLLLPAYLAFKFLGEVAIWLWDHAIKPSFDFIADKAKWLWNQVLSPVFGWIGDKAKWLYEKAIKPYFESSKRKFEALASAAKWIWDHVLSPVFGWIGDKAGWLYEKAIKPAFDNIKRAIKLVSDSFATARDAIKKAWDAVAGIAKKPVKFIIEHVYNGGIVPLWNKVASITGADPLKKMDLKNFHTGGIMPGYTPGRDNQIIAVGGGEAIMRPEWTRAVGADTINSWNAAARQGGVGGVRRAIQSGMPAYKDGGIVGWFKDRAGDVGDFFSAAADFANPVKVFDKAKAFIGEKLQPILTNPWSKAIANIPYKFLSGLKDRALDFLGFGGGGPGGAGTWAKPVHAPYGTPFGKRGSMWSSGRHTGLDFPAAVGAAIRAVDNGRVALAKSGGPYGNHVLINHGGGLASLYAHMSSMVAQVGKSVRQGQTIGSVGATGNVTGPHLHLEARVNGRAVDPMTYLQGYGGGNGGKGVARWRQVVEQALMRTGNPMSYTDLTLRRMNQESGGNPRAVNNWDINAKNGTPSVGLMQVIKPTFDAYAGSMRGVGPKLHGVSINPLANVYASMRYAMSRYGNLPKAYNRPGGYAAGGFPGAGELAWVGEQGPELVRFLAPAQVYNNRDSMALARSAQAIPSRGATTLHADVKVFVGNREITDIVDTQIELYDADVARDTYTGRRL
ncbi:peptidoglycan DD-metalloendopeptidase family protein [Streptomyces sp. NPDC091376]|uniref:peptidoglycan DD-metalloendopeptidase family protein n=1 Tax=Streptomyces sp. NPDC091376 TaxID=3365994 RepID=UPI00382D47C5